MAAIMSSSLLICCPAPTTTSGRVDYEVLVPADASITLRSTSGPLRAEKLHGDIVLEGNTATVDVRDISEGHVHVKTLDGPVTLTNINDAHVEITSVSGDVALNSVNGPLVSVNSASGWIHYDGDFGGGGEYSLMTHTGDIEATAPLMPPSMLSPAPPRVKSRTIFPYIPRIPLSSPALGVPSQVPWERLHLQLSCFPSVVKSTSRNVEN